MAFAPVGPQLGPHIPNLHPIQRPQLYKFAEQVTQMAIRILFVASCVLMAAYVAPLAIYNFTVATAAIGATCLSGFFFPQPKLFLGGYEFPGIGALLGLEAQAIEMPQGAPRGLHNTGNNCFLNTLVHYLDADPALARWIRTPLNNLEGFINFMNDYPQPPNLMVDFRAYIRQRQQAALQQHQQQGGQGNVIRMPPLMSLFRDFLAQYQVDQEHQRVFNNFKDYFEAIDKVKIPFARFLQQYDQAVQNNLPVAAVDSQQLRRALIDFKPWLQNPYGINDQLDASEILTFILLMLPPRMSMEIEEVKNLRNPFGEGRVAINDPPIVEVTPKIEMAIPDGKGPFLLSDVFSAWHLDTLEHEPVRRQGVDGIERNYPIESCSHQFLIPPPALRIAFKRFEKPPTSWLTRLCVFFWPQLNYAKKATPIDVPEFLTIQTKDGQRHQYQLASFGTHLGVSKESGHYLGGRIVNGEKYIVNDTHVTHVQTEADTAQWNEYLRGSYLLNYVPVARP